MTIKSIVTRGYGNGTFNGTIAEVVTRGYTIGEAAAVPQIPGAIKVPRSTTTWGALVAQAEGRDKNLPEPQYQFSNGRTFY